MSFSCLKYLILLLLKDPIRSIIVLLIYRFKPEICLNLSRICISFWNVSMSHPLQMLHHPQTSFF